MFVKITDTRMAIAMSRTVQIAFTQSNHETRVDHFDRADHRQDRTRRTNLGLYLIEMALERLRRCAKNQLVRCVSDLLVAFRWLGNDLPTSKTQPFLIIPCRSGCSNWW